MTVHPCTLEIFEMRGMVDQLLSAGEKLPGASVGQLDTLLDFAGRRGHRVTGLAETTDAVTLTVDGPDGPYEIKGLYAVGCDGARSRPRSRRHPVPRHGHQRQSVDW